MNEVPAGSEASAAFAPLSDWDEYPIHQTIAPIRFVQTTDPRAFERYWFTTQPKDGRFFFVMGVGFYPNLGINDGYALLNHKGRQVTVRAQAGMPSNRGALQVGPVSAEPTGTFGEWKLSVSDNEQGLRAELRWHDTKRANFRNFDMSRIPGMPPGIHLIHNWGGYETFGAIEGWIEFDGERLELAPGDCVGSRDHHWGTRDGVGALTIGRKRSDSSHVGQFVEFSDWALWADQVLYNVGAEQRYPAYSEATDHKLAFDPVTKHFREGLITNRLSNGETRVLHFRHIPGATAYLRCAGYSGGDGIGTPDGNHHHGQDLGGAASGVVYDVSDPEVRMEIAGFEDQVCTVEYNGETATGILECCNPALYNMCKAGVPGFSFLEHE